MASPLDQPHPLSSHHCSPPCVLDTRVARGFAELLHRSLAFCAFRGSQQRAKLHPRLTLPRLLRAPPNLPQLAGRAHLSRIRSQHTRPLPRFHSQQESVCTFLLLPARGIRPSLWGLVLPAPKVVVAFVRCLPRSPFLDELQILIRLLAWCSFPWHQAATVLG